jgi:hypothetical protein
MFFPIRLKISPAFFLLQLTSKFHLFSCPFIPQIPSKSYSLLLQHFSHFWPKFLKCFQLFGHNWIFSKRGTERRSLRLPLPTTFSCSSKLLIFAPRHQNFHQFLIHWVNICCYPLFDGYWVSGPRRKDLASIYAQ